MPPSAPNLAPALKAEIETLLTHSGVPDAIQAMQAAPVYRYIGAVLGERLAQLQLAQIGGLVTQEESSVAVAKLRRDLLLVLEGKVLRPEGGEIGSDQALPDVVRKKVELVGKIITDDLREYYSGADTRQLIPLEFEVNTAYVQRSVPDRSANPPPIDSIDGTAALGAGIQIDQVYEALHGNFLLLGAAGSGKSYTLRHLASYLVQKAQLDINSPVPVILDLRNWQVLEQSIATWVVEQMHTIYLLPRETIQGWLTTGQLVPILDSLDAVAAPLRPLCIQAINEFRAEEHPPGLVVASREQAYHEAGAKLDLEAALVLKPLALTVITQYLHQEQVGTAELLNAINTDAGLFQLAQTPLALRMLVLVFRAGGLNDLLGYQGSELRERLYARFMDAVFVLRPAETQPFAEAQTRHWLQWLASNMHRCRESLLRYEELQPNWLEQRRQRLFYFITSRLTLGLVAGMLGGIIIGMGLDMTAENLWRGVLEGVSGGAVGGVLVGILAALWNQQPPRAASRQVRLWQTLLRILAMTSVAALGVALFFSQVLARIPWCELGWIEQFCRFDPKEWLSEGLSVGMVVGLSFGLVLGVERDGAARTLERDILAASLERLSWSLRNVPFFALVAALLGGVAGAISAFLAALVPSLGSPINNYIEDLGFGGRLALLATALLGAGFCGLAMLLVAGLSGSAILPERRTSAKQAIEISFWNGLRVGGGAMLGLGLLGAVIGWFGGSGYAISFALYGIFFGYLVFLAFGGLDAWLHFCLRYTMWRANYTPPPGHFISFLTYGCDLQLLEFKQGGYDFRHVTWRDFLARQGRRPTISPPPAAVLPTPLPEASRS